MADAEEVSSTTPNGVQEEAAAAGAGGGGAGGVQEDVVPVGDLKGSSNEAEAKEENVKDETKEKEVVAPSSVPAPVAEPEPVVSSTMEEPVKKQEQKVEEPTTDKAETELSEKTDLVTSSSETKDVKESVQKEELEKPEKLDEQQQVVVEEAQTAATADVVEAAAAEPVQSPVIEETAEVPAAAEVPVVVPVEAVPAVPIVEAPVPVEVPAAEVPPVVEEKAAEVPVVVPEEVPVVEAVEELVAAAPVQEVTASPSPPPAAAEESLKAPPAEEQKLQQQPEQEPVITAVPEPAAEPAAAVSSTVEFEEPTLPAEKEKEVIEEHQDLGIHINLTAAAPAPEVEEEPTPAAPAPPLSHEPSLPAPAAASAATFPPLMQFTSEYGDSSPIASQDIGKITMDSFGNDSPSRSMPRYEPDVLNQSDDDLMFEIKKPFQNFSPVNNPSSEFSLFGETTADTRAATMSDSPSPDLVQNAHDGELQDEVQDYEQSFDSREEATESLRQQLASSDLFTTAPKEHEESGLPPSLPDILKSSPLNPDKVDSGSSEGSPDFSPVHRSGNDSPNAPFSLSGNNPFAFETKVPLLKEMTEETEAKAAAEKAKKDAETKASEQMFGTFDLVKEAETSPKGTETTVEDKDDFKTFNQDSVQMADKFECLSFPTGKAQEHSDSESPSADSLSPVLEAMGKNPASFQIEPEKNIVIEEREEEEEAADEVSEQEVSSEEFEFVEKPPRGAIDEFLETLDNSKFAKAAEMVDEEEDILPSYAEKTEAEEEEEEEEEEESFTVQETKNQSSYLLLTEPLDGASSARGKAGLELSDFQVPSQAPLAHSPVVKADTMTMKTAEPQAVKLPNLKLGSVVDLLYWRDVKNTGVVFGASLLLLLSLSVCSIISVLSYVALALLSVTITFRIYKGILQAIQKSDEGHPFKQYLDQEVALPAQLVHKYSDIALGRINATMVELRRLFLVEDLVDSLKFAVFMWILTYVGALFNGLTILILGLIGAFSCPIVYEKHQNDPFLQTHLQKVLELQIPFLQVHLQQTQIDHYVALINNQVKDVVGKIQAKIPGAKKKAE
uniref:Reticulon n=1 Tax=Astyanax mexicanus TaxID=7994 RepID=A0A8B9J8F9_ASTMX